MNLVRWRMMRERLKDCFVQSIVFYSRVAWPCGIFSVAKRDRNKNDTEHNKQFFVVYLSLRVQRYRTTG